MQNTVANPANPPSNFEDIIDQIISREANNLAIRDKITSFLVKKQKRGTYQAFEESETIEQEIVENIRDYIKKWVFEELTQGKFKSKFYDEISKSFHLELSRKGFDVVLKK